ncbi:MAG: tRNA preQ1(34) S-adenosylmethionine ribosyltransferase-isomerase QueA [Planctomycetota bacterium]
MSQHEPPTWARTAYRFDLPPGLIAQQPADRRDESRLMVVGAPDADRDGGQTVQHRVFRELPALLRPDDLLVLNSTRVRPARFFATRPTGARVEVLLIGCDGESARALLRGNSPLRGGDTLVAEGHGELRVVGPPGEGGVRELAVPGAWLTREVLLALGAPPLPPYIRRERDDPRLRELDAERYQTVYARDDGDDFSVAAPTAGLHFTPELLQQAVAACAGKIELQLEVGLGTFQPVRADDIREHPMHAERFRLSGDALRTLRAHRAGGGRVVAVGTTSARVLETLAQHDAGATGLPAQIADMPGGGVEGQTAIFIHPPRRPSGFDALITNFHLPESTLVMLVAALLGRERTLDLYREAVARSYRFFSYGDAMFIRQF